MKCNRMVFAFSRCYEQQKASSGNSSRMLLMTNFTRNESRLGSNPKVGLKSWAGNEQLASPSLTFARGCRANRLPVQASDPMRRERRGLQWFYNHSAIDAAAQQPSVRLTPTTILYTGKNGDSGLLLVNINVCIKFFRVLIFVFFFVP